VTRERDDRDDLIHPKVTVVVGAVRSGSRSSAPSGAEVIVYRVQSKTGANIITGGVFRRLRETGTSILLANRARKELLDRVFSSDPVVRLNALQGAQASGRNSPFISTTLSRAVAEEGAAALRATGVDVELITIRGLRDGGIDFEAVLDSLGGRTKPGRFRDAALQEFGIPDLYIPVQGPSRSGFEVIRRE
jgi:hypothetical protein